MPTRTGYDFLFWFTGDNEHHQEINKNTIAPEDDVVAIAAWNPYTYTIRYNANGGIGTMEDKVMQYGIGSNLDTNQFTKDEHIFLGWSTSPTGDVRWEDGENVSNLTSEKNAIFNLYAIWGSAALHNIV